MPTIDTFMANDEYAMLECRLSTMADAVDWFVIVEGDVDHQGHPKAYHMTEAVSGGMFDKWRDKLVVVRATDLPTTPHTDDPWSREFAQRDWVWQGLAQIEELRGEPLPDETIVLHGDVDEICEPLAVRNVRPRPREFVAFQQRMHSFALDWLHPDVWGGTVAVLLGSVRAMHPRKIVPTPEVWESIGDATKNALPCPKCSPWINAPRFFLELVDGRFVCSRCDFNSEWWPVVWHPGQWQIVRNQRNRLVSENFQSEGPGWAFRRYPGQDLTNEGIFYGWHFTWMGGRDAAIKKLGSFCHPEVADQIDAGLKTNLFLREGMHVDGRVMRPVEIDDTYPQWIQDGNAPAEWYRPRT